MGYYAKDFSESVLLMNKHLTKNVPKETLFKADDPWLTNEDTKPYILDHIENIKLSKSQYIAISIINYGAYRHHVCPWRIHPYFS